MKLFFKAAAVILALLLAAMPAEAASTTTKLKNNLNVTGNLTVGGTSAVTGNQTFTGNVSVGGTLGVTGVATFTAKPVLSTGTISANGDTITIQDLGNANIVQTEGTQTINGAKTFSTAPTITGGLTAANIQTGSAKRQVFTAYLSPNTGAAADGTVYRATIFPGRAGTVTRISFGCQTAPTVGTDTLKVLKGSSSGNTMLSTATVDANGLTANQVTTATLTATGADLAIPASGAGSCIYCEYSAGTQTVDAIGVTATIEYEPTDF